MLRTESELCQPDGVHGKTGTVPVPVGWTKSTRHDGCAWVAPDGMGSMSVSDVGEKQATLAAVQEAAKNAPGFVAGYREVALYGDRDFRFGETVVWESLGEDVYTFHFAGYYAAGWRASLMLDEPRWDTTGAATFAEIRREFTPLP